MSAFFLSTLHAEEDAVSLIYTKSLANGCMSCHGANTMSDSKTPGIAGLDQKYFINKMLEFRQSVQNTNIETAHTLNLSEQEITDLASYFAKQSRACPFYQQHPIKLTDK